MEYNVDLLDGLDIYQRNSLTIILDQIMPETTVLEFGPAYGRMTKFLKENLKCQVSCIEINPKTKSTLEKYAQKVLIENIEDYGWTKDFEKGTFDYVIFADVLEHLTDPQKALQVVTPLLKTNGIIFISIPNLAHNAVIESLYFNKFNYQEWGILDKTHLRFFAKESLEQMILDCNLKVASRHATYYTNEMTGILDSNSKDPELEMFLEQRPLSTVYQFVYGLCKGESKYKNCDDYIDKYSERLTAKLYYDEGAGFSEENTIKEYFYKSNNIFLTFIPSQPLHVQSIRFDPADFSCVCKINELVIKDTNGQDYKVDIEGLDSNALYQSDGIFVFDTQDPQLFVRDFRKEMASVKINMSLIGINLEKSFMLNILMNFGRKKTEQLSATIQSEKQLYQDQIINLNNEISVLKNDIEFKTQRISKLENENELEKQEIKGLRNEISRLKSDNKSKEKEIEKLNDEVIQEKEDNKQKEKEIDRLNFMINQIQTEFNQKESNMLQDIKDLTSGNNAKDIEIEGLNSSLRITEEKVEKLKDEKEKMQFEKNLQILKYLDQELKETVMRFKEEK